MNGNSWPIDAPSPTDHEYLCFTAKGFDEDAAAAHFEQRFGYPPEYIIADYCRYCWLGPIVRADETHPPRLGA